MTDRHPLLDHYPADNLLRAPFLPYQCLDFLPDLAIYSGLHLVVTLHQCQMADLLGPITPQPPIPAQLSADGRFIPLQKLGNLCLVIFSLLQDIIWYRSPWVR